MARVIENCLNELDEQKETMLDSIGKLEQDAKGRVEEMGRQLAAAQQEGKV